MIVRVRAQRPDGHLREGRLWLSQRHLLDRNNWQRRAAGLAASYAGTMADDEALAFADLLLQVTSELALARQAEGTGASRPSAEPPGDVEPPDPTVAVEKLVREGEHRVGGEGLSRASRDALEQVFRSLAYWEPPDEADPSEDDEEGAEERPERGEPSSHPPEPYRSGTIRSLEERLRRSLDHWTRTRPKVSNVPDLVRMLDTRTRGLVDLVIRTLRSDDLNGGERLTQALLDSLRTAFSLAGAEAGRPDGWMVRAWTAPDTREVVREALRDAYPALVAHLGALQVIANFLDVTTSGGIALLMGGLQVGAERRFVLEGADAEGLLSREIDRIARRSEGLVTDADILAVLQAADDEIRSSRAIRSARWWAAAIPGTDYRIPTDAPDTVRQLVEARRRGRSVKLRGVVAGLDGMYCGCGVKIAETMRQAMERDERQVKLCESCHSHMLPFAIENPAAVELFRSFFFDLKAEDR